MSVLCTGFQLKLKPDLNLNQTPRGVRIQTTSQYQISKTVNAKEIIRSKRKFKVLSKQTYRFILYSSSHGVQILVNSIIFNPVHMMKPSFPSATGSFILFIKESLFTSSSVSNATRVATTRLKNKGK